MKVTGIWDKVKVTKEDFEAATCDSWSPRSCLVAQALERHYACEVINVDHMSARVKKGNVLLTFGLMEVSKLIRRFDRAVAIPEKPDLVRLGKIRADLPVTFRAKLEGAEVLIEALNTGSISLVDLEKSPKFGPTI